MEISYSIRRGVPPIIRGDVTRVRQILTNLLGNAVKFTRRGEIAVEVDATALGEDDFRLEFSVRDTGIGIPPERVDRLFDSFSQVDTSTTRRYGGTGLGLAISKRLTEIMGGSMRVESEAGVGSTFRFSIRARAGESTSGGTNRSAPLRGKRALVVHPHAATRRMLVDQMDGWGITTIAAASALETLSGLDDSRPFDVAIIERDMTDMDGPNLAKELASRGNGSAVPVVMLFRLGQRGDAESSCISAWLAKPPRRDHLMNTLLEVLGLDARRAAPASASNGSGVMADDLPLRVLVAEDNIVNQKVIARFLGRLGYRPDIVTDGTQALEALEEGRYEVVLMDVQMPGMDGLEATRRIVNRYDPPDRPYIIAVTANATKRDYRECLDAGMDDYLSKPLQLDDLIAALRRSRVPEESAGPSTTP